MKIFSRRFDQSDIDQFARLSGDLNVVHTDPILARRLLFGGTVCHGVAQVLWTLDCLASCLGCPFHLRHVAATFRGPVMAGDSVRLELSDMVDGAARATLFSPRSSCSSVTVQWEEAVATSRSSLPAPLGAGLVCRDRQFADLARAEGEVPVGVTAEELMSFAPHLWRWGRESDAATLLATTRLVGMECPGLHSVFHSLKLDFQEGKPESTLRYRVTSANERYGRLVVAVQSNACRGELVTSIRPAPKAQLSFSEIRQRVAPHAYDGERALVIGGSRGLGELATKILVAGGAAVRASFSRGQADAQRIATEIKSEKPGADLKIFHFDVTRGDLDIAEEISDFHPTQLYFFASPKILLDGGPTFDTARYDRYRHFYVTAMVLLVRKVVSLGDRPVRVFLPSTAFIDVPPLGSAEYVAAKKAAEEALADLARELGLLPIIHRMPPLATDQTASLGAVQQADGFAAVAAAIQAMREAAAGR